MKITHLKTDHMVNPIGNELLNPTVSFVVEDTDAVALKSVRIQAALDEKFQEIIFDSEERDDIMCAAFDLPIETRACTRYFWRVSAVADNGDSAISDTAWFETPKRDAWHADWITPNCSKEQQVILQRRFNTGTNIKKARMYMVGLGEYELYINSRKVSDECLLPGFCAYDSWVPFQTFEVELREGENLVEIMLGDGWYKGNFGLRKKYENYGDRLAAIGELHVFYEDGHKEVLCTDSQWQAVNSFVAKTGIYSGETVDMNVDAGVPMKVRTLDIDKKKLMPRLNPRLRVQQKLNPVKLIHTPAGETVLDMGQNMVGWIQMHCHVPKYTTIHLQFGELLQDGNFYRDNLRTALAEFYYVSDGKERDVRQYFTFYGFRYVKISGYQVTDTPIIDGEGYQTLCPDDFTGLVIHSDMEETGFIETSNELVNKLFLNTKWGQRGNFVDVPTDCPQRDERYGWTGDAQVFSGTACFNTDVYAFYAKYGYDIYQEQKKYDGGVPDTVPIAGNESTISTAWGEAATIIPWNVYLTYGDPSILRLQYDSMKAWVDYMKREDDKYGAKRLWQTGFHFGDWLALDGPVDGGVFGRTDPYLIASAYYYYSTRIVEMAAGVLGKETECNHYGKLAEEIRDAFFNEYYSPNGRLCDDTMTAYVLVLYTGLVPVHALPVVRKGLMNKLRKSKYHLETGFVGTPYLCRVLSENGMNDIAYHLLMEKGYPGWLYEVLMGATTIWERWNSILPDGKISGTEMNSMNHYAYGSIVEWMYRNMLGIRPKPRAYMVMGDHSTPESLRNSVGYRRFRIAPQPNWQLQWAKGDFRSPYGNIHSEWKIEGEKLYFKVTVPACAECELVLPDAEASAVRVKSKYTGEDEISLLKVRGICAERFGEALEDAGKVRITLCAGTYEFSYVPTVPYRKVYSIDSPMQELIDYAPARKVLDEELFSVHGTLPFFGELHTLREHLNSPFLNLPYDRQDEIDRRLREVK